MLQALATISRRRGVSISAVATRYVRDIPIVSAVIVGTRLTSDSTKYIQSNLSAFSFQLSEEDRALIAKAQEKLHNIPGDCGDEYRRPPFLTAKGDLSDHLKESKESLALSKAVAQGMRIEYSSESTWESIAVSNIRPVFTTSCGEFIGLLSSCTHWQHHSGIRHHSKFSDIHYQSRRWIFGSKPNICCAGRN